MKINFYNRNFLKLLIILNFIGIVAAFYTYIPDIKKQVAAESYFLIPFFMVSVWLYLLAFFGTFYLHSRREFPIFFGGLIFLFSFVYGLGSLLFYPLFMFFVYGFSLYHFWNIFAHGFVGFQSVLFFRHLKKQKFYSFAPLVFLFLFYDFLGIFYGGFLYFTDFGFPFFLKMFLIFFIVFLQVLAFYLLYKKA